MKNKCGVPTLPPISTLHFEASHEAIFRNLRDEAHGAPPASNCVSSEKNVGSPTD